jgi:hypothetical protein
MVRVERPQAELEVVTVLGPVVGTHAGPGTVGFFWFADTSCLASPEAAASPISGKFAVALLIQEA